MHNNEQAVRSNTNIQTVSKKFFSTPGVENLQPTAKMQPAWTSDMARIRIFITQFRQQKSRQNEALW